MNKPVFDAGSFVEINLSEGAVVSREDDRLALISTDILKALPPSEPLHRAAAQWGKRHGARLDMHLRNESASDAAGLEALSEHLGGTLAVLGMGRIRLEIRQDALLLRASQGGGESEDTGAWSLLAGFLSGYLSGLSGHPFDVIDLGEDSSERLFFAVNPEAAEAARAALQAGETPMDVVDGLMTRRPSC